METAELENHLEALIDATSLDQVVEALRVICYCKADHLRVNWQDPAGARTWERAGSFFARPSASVQAL